MSGTPTIDALVQELEHSIVASRRKRREIAREIGGDLAEAIDARIASGTEMLTAEREVAAEFGPTAPVAAELSAELLADHGKRFAPLAAVAATALLVAWFVIMSALVALPGFAVPAGETWMLSLSRALDTVTPVVAAAALAGWFMIRRFGSRAALIAVAALQLGFSVVLSLGALALAHGTVVPAAGLPLLVALVIGTVAVGGTIAVAAARLLGHATLVFKIERQSY